VKRRQFITLLGGTVAWPLAARAQQGQRVPRIGVIMAIEEGDAQAADRMRMLNRKTWGGPTAATCGLTCAWDRVQTTFARTSRR
jgi:hypothetical protein